MRREITAMVDECAAGRLTRRDRVCALAALVATAARGGSDVSVQQPHCALDAELVLEAVSWTRIDGKADRPLTLADV